MGSQTGSGERIDSLDFIRGVAILGILLMNVMGMAAPEAAYYAPGWYGGAGGWDQAIYVVQSLFIESRFMGMFSLLFGVGLAIQWDRESARDRPPGRRIRRRLAWLLIFGLIHGFLIWFGDILTPYAIAGFVVYRAARWPLRRLVRTAVVLLVVAQLPLLLALVSAAMTGVNVMELPEVPYAATELGTLRAEWTGSLARTTANATMFARSLTAIPLLFFWQNSGTMLAGMALYRSRFFTDPPPRGRLLLLMVSGLVGALLVLLLRYRLGPATSAGYATLGLMMLPGLAMAIAYAGLMVPLASRSGWLVRALRNTGKTAFTLYIGQSLVVVSIFAFVVPQLWGALGRGPLWIGVALFSVAEVAFADWWQRRYGQGPLERMWRRLVAGRAPRAAVG